MKITNKYLSTIFLTIFLVLIYGMYLVYDIFYSNYFDQTNYKETVFINSTEIPSKLKILLSGFQNLKIIFVSLLISIITVQIVAKVKK